MSSAHKGEIFVCQKCQASFETREASCHYHHTIPVERAVVRDALGRVIDCTQSSGVGPFRVAKVATGA